VSKGFLKPSDIATVNDRGNQIDGPLPRTSEILLHLEIYHALPGINAVCHAHPPHATAFAVAGIEVPSGILPEVEIFLGQIPTADYETPGSKTFAETILPYLQNEANTILLANHGAVACDQDLLHAYFHLETLDMYCKILLLTKQIGSIQQIPGTKIEELLAIKDRMGIADQRAGCEGEQCRLAGSDEFLRGFSTFSIPQHDADPDGHGRGRGIAGTPSQAGQPQPLPPRQTQPSKNPPPSSNPALGQSSLTARQRAAEDEIERVVQVVTDQILAGARG
jgi:L-fuculose-phosphate aldolase